MYYIYTYSIVCYDVYYIFYIYIYYVFLFRSTSADSTIYFGPVTAKIAKKSDEPNQRN